MINGNPPRDDASHFEIGHIIQKQKNAEKSDRQRAAEERSKRFGIDFLSETGGLARSFFHDEPEESAPYAEAVPKTRKTLSWLCQQGQQARSLIENQQRNIARQAYEAARLKEQYFTEQIQPYSKRFFDVMTYLSWFAGCTNEEAYPQCIGVIHTAHQQIRHIMSKSITQQPWVNPAPNQTSQPPAPDEADMQALLLYFLFELEDLQKNTKNRRSKAESEEAFRQAVAPWAAAGASGDRVSCESYLKETRKIQTRLSNNTAAYDCKEALQHAMKLIVAIIQTDERYLDAQTCCQWGRQARALFDDWHTSSGATLRWVDYSLELEERIRVTYSSKECHTFPALFYTAAGSSELDMLLHGGLKL